MSAVRFLLRATAGIAALYLLACLLLFVIMLQPPDRLGRAVARIPGPLLFGPLPFRQLWFVARDGHLKVGDDAPDFQLATLDKKSRVQLSSLRGQRPVVLVFGSYT